MFRGLGVVLLRGGLFSRRQPGRQHPLEGLFLDAHMFQLPGQEVLLVQDAGDAAVLLPPDAAAAEVNCTGCYECGQSDSQRQDDNLFVHIRFLFYKGPQRGPERTCILSRLSLILSLSASSGASGHKKSTDRSVLRSVPAGGRYARWDSAILRYSAGLMPHCRRNRR